MYSFEEEVIYSTCWPLLIVAGLLLAAVQSHHSVAFTPHILTYYPLSGVAGTSPKKRHSFFQLHSVEIKRHDSECIGHNESLLLSRRSSFQWQLMVFFFCLAVYYPDGSLYCLVFKTCPSCCLGFDHTVLVSQENNWPFYTCVLLCVPPVNHIIKAQKTAILIQNLCILNYLGVSIGVSVNIF